MASELIEARNPKESNEPSVWRNPRKISELKVGRNPTDKSESN